MVVGETHHFGKPPYIFNNRLACPPEVQRVGLQNKLVCGSTWSHGNGLGKPSWNPKNVGWNVAISFRGGAWFRRLLGSWGLKRHTSWFRGVLLIGKSSMLLAKSMGRIWGHLKPTISLQTTGGLVEGRLKSSPTNLLLGETSDCQHKCNLL